MLLLHGLLLPPPPAMERPSVPHRFITGFIDANGFVGRAGGFINGVVVVGAVVVLPHGLGMAIPVAPANCPRVVVMFHSVGHS